VDDVETVRDGADKGGVGDSVRLIATSTYAELAVTLHVDAASPTPTAVGVLINLRPEPVWKPRVAEIDVQADVKLTAH